MRPSINVRDVASDLVASLAAISIKKILDVMEREKKKTLTERSSK
jgi:hypothetical protein